MARRTETEGERTSHVDPTIPDPFGRAGYRGVTDRHVERERERAVLVAHGMDPDGANIPGGGRVLAAPDVACYEFPNGYGAWVLLGDATHPACSGCSAERPFEMAVSHAGRICNASPVTEDVLCGLDPDAVRAMLDEIAALAPDADCDHGRPE